MYLLLCRLGRTVEKVEGGRNMQACHASKNRGKMPHYIDIIAQ
jgi:hypothetical protein